MHPEILSLSLFMLVTSCSPGPNNIVASYSGFNFGLAKTVPHMCGVIFGFTTLVIIMNFGLVNIFKKFPILQEILKYAGSIFLIYLAYKIAFSKTKSDESSKNPVKFIETFFFQFLNPKAVIVSIIMVSTYVENGENFINYSIWVIGVAFIFACFRHHLDNDVRKSLYESCDEYLSAVRAAGKGPYLGGTQPNLADLVSKG